VVQLKKPDARLPCQAGNPDLRRLIAKEVSPVSISLGPSAIANRRNAENRRGTGKWSNRGVAAQSIVRVIREYIIWRVEDGAIDWFVLREGQYEQLQRTADGLLKSEQMPGLWLDADALLRFDLARVLQVLQQGLASPEHAAFVAQLQQRGNAGRS
jgi:hypothetical protein